MLHLRHADIAFRLIIVKWRLKIVHESQHSFFVIPKVIKQVSHWALLDPAAFLGLIHREAMKPGISLTERIKALEYIEKRMDELGNRYHVVDIDAE